MNDGVDVVHLAVMAQLDDFMLAPTVAEDREFHQILGSCDHFFPKIAVAKGFLLPMVGARGLQLLRRLSCRLAAMTGCYVMSDVPGVGGMPRYSVWVPCWNMLGSMAGCIWCCVWAGPVWVTCWMLFLGCHGWVCHDWVCHGWVRLLGAVAVLGAMGAMADCHDWVRDACYAIWGLGWPNLLLMGMIFF